MFPNLNAEQARYSESNATVAGFLGLSRVAYEGKKRSGKFSLNEATRLCQKYKCDYSYLFAEDPIVPIHEERREVEK